MKASTMLPLIKFYDAIAHLKLDLKIFIKMIQILHLKFSVLKYIIGQHLSYLINCLNVCFEFLKV